MYDAIYDLKEMLCKQLNDYGKKGELTAAVLERVDMLSHAVKNLDHIIDHMEESDYSNAGGRSYRGDDGRSMARGRGSNARRDSMGRYSSDGYSQDGEIADQLRSMADMAPDERTRQEINRIASRMEGR
jgi:hypothetical protein